MTGEAEQNLDPTLASKPDEAVTEENRKPAKFPGESTAEIGEVIGGYKLQKVLGRGGMGTVFEGQHTVLGRAAAIKVLAPKLSDQSDQVSRFFQEARIVNDVQNTNIVEIYDFVYTEEPKRVAFVMEKLTGSALSEHLKGGVRFTDTQAVNLCIQICDALAAVHNAKVIHRDLKPDNIYVVNSIDSDFSYVPSVKLLDFGIAKQSDGVAAHKTATGMVLGTPAYMAPEQISGEAPNEKSDVYALCLVLYEMLTGKRLFVGDQTAILRRKVLEDTPVIPPLPSGPCSHQFHAILTWGLIREPKNRPSAKDFARALLEIVPEVLDTRMASHDTFLDIKALARTPAPNIFQIPQGLQGQVSPQDGLEPESSDSEIFAATKAPRFQMFGIIAIIFAITLVGFAKWYASKPTTQVFSHTPDVKPVKRQVTRSIKPTRIRSLPAGAQILDDATGVILGTTPYSLLLHPQESKRIRVVKKSYRSQTVTFTFGEVSKLIKLKRKMPAPKVGKTGIPKSPPIFREKNPKQIPSNTPPEDEGLLKKKEIPEWN